MPSYHPLDQSLRQIRLAHILPTQSERIDVELQTVSLDDNPVYDALSYCWGNPKHRATIRINGQAREVTVSLEAALRVLRNKSQGNIVVLWADSICINQRDTRERGQQVSIMPDIYRSA